MRRSIIYVALLAGALLVPTADTELGKMKPVETLSIQHSNGQITLSTDADDFGTGESVAQAVQDLQETTSGMVFLDTTDYLLVGENATSYIRDLAPYIKRSAQVCEIGADVVPKDAGEYLRSHKPETKLKQWKEGIRLQKLVCEHGRLKLS